MSQKENNKAQSRPATPQQVWSRSLSHVPKWAKNKYLLSFGFFAVWMLFFDRNDLITQFHRNAEYKCECKYNKAERGKNSFELRSA